MKAVWASKWNGRAFTALAAAGAAPAQLQMAVLAQGVLPAAYAWVAHTRHPVTGPPPPPPGGGLPPASTFTWERVTKHSCVVLQAQW